MRKGALEIGDYAYARLPTFERRVESALMVIEDAAKKGRIAVSYSGGKDSTVLLDLVRQVQPDCAVGFFDSGCEYPWTYEIVQHYGAEVVKPERSLPEMCRHGGYWGYENPTDPDAEFDFFAFLIAEPAQRFRVTHECAVEAIGLRCDESATRRISLHKRGQLYYVKGQETWHVCPLAFWKLADIWAYLASRKLRYNHVYDLMADHGIDRREQRVSTLLGTSALAFNARIAFIRAVAPDVFWRLAAEFPMIKQHT